MPQNGIEFKIIATAHKIINLWYIKDIGSEAKNWRGRWALSINALFYSIKNRFY